MKVLIKEEKRNDLIEKYILNTFPMVGKVTFETKKVQLASGENIRGENVINRTKIHIDFIDGKMTHSPSYMLRKIKNQINPIFGLDIESYGSDWGLEGKMVQNANNNK
jgi:hypothetical protein